MKRLTVLGIRGIPAAHGGFETFAERLCLWLRDRGWLVTVYCQGTASEEAREDCWEGVRRVHVPARGGAIGTIEFDAKATQLALREPGLFLTLGYNTGFLSSYVRSRRRMNVINMDGIEWKRAKYGPAARVYLWLNERMAAASGQRLIADHPVIADHLSERADPRKIVMIPYGADVLDGGDARLLEKYGLNDQRFLTLIARPEPENSVLELVRSFSSQRRRAKLVVLGVYNRTSDFQSSVLDSASDEVLFLGPVYERESLRALRYHSLAYCHGHRVGGTNPSLVEALGAGNPVIAHDNPFNRWVAADAGLYFSDEGSLGSIWTQVIDEPDRRAMMSAAARSRCEESFTWPIILRAYEELLEEALRHA